MVHIFNIFYHATNYTKSFIRDSYIAKNEREAQIIKKHIKTVVVEAISAFIMSNKVNKLLLNIIIIKTLIIIKSMPVIITVIFLFITADL